MSGSELMKNHEAFLNADLSGLAGKWVAIIDGKIAGSGDNLKILLDEVKKESPGKKPLLAKAPTKRVLILAAHKNETFFQI